MKLYDESLQELLKQPRDIVVIGHRNPDGDAMGATVALRLLLKRLGHFVDIIVPSEYPPVFSYLKDIDQTVIYDIEPDRAKMLVDRSEIVFCLDFNTLHRIDKLGEAVEASNASTVLIDHHLDPDPSFEYMFSDTGSSSTCELIYDFIVDMGYARWMTQDIGTAIFTGLITDTGSFKYSTRSNTYAVATALKHIGVDDSQIQDTILNSQKEKHLRLLGHCLANRMEVISEYRAALIYLTKEDYTTFDIQRGDTEGIVNYMLTMKDVDIAAFITEQPTIVKVSLRSKGDISVQDMATKYFNGGGHKNASGGGVYASLDAIIARYKKILPEYHQPKI